VYALKALIANLLATKGLTFGTVTDQMMLQISHQTTGAAMWKEIKTLHEGKSTLVKADV
jgi:hypothetical protein